MKINELIAAHSELTDAAAGKSAVVLIATNVDLAPTDAPAGLAVTAEGNGAVGLTWNGVGGAVGYNVYRSRTSPVQITQANQVFDAIFGFVHGAVHHGAARLQTEILSHFHHFQPARRRDFQRADCFFDTLGQNFCAAARQR